MTFVEPQVEVIQVVRTTLTRRGEGIPDDPVRAVTQYWSLDGELLAEFDAWAQTTASATKEP